MNVLRDSGQDGHSWHSNCATGSLSDQSSSCIFFFQDKQENYVELCASAVTRTNSRKSVNWSHLESRARHSVCITLLQTPFNKHCKRLHQERKNQVNKHAELFLFTFSICTTSHWKRGTTRWYRVYLDLEAGPTSQAKYQTCL